MELSIIIPASACQGMLERTVQGILTFMSKSAIQEYEIILIPNGDPALPTTDATRAEAQRLAREYLRVVVCDSQARGKGAALKEGFHASRGRWILFTDADLPYDLSFITEASAKLSQGTAFITGNRRLSTSRFNIPVRNLRLAYRRHLLGLLFNKAVRLFFPITTRDTQAGIKAMTRELAEIAFSRQSCPGFLFDIELFLVALNHGYRHAELPVCLHLESEKSTVRLVREFFVTLVWLGRIWSNQRQGWYGRDIFPGSLYPQTADVAST